MYKELKQTYNPYFHLPFLLWVIIGGILLATLDTKTLFLMFNGHHTVFLDRAMFIITYLGDGAVVALIMLILLGINSMRNWWYFLTALLINLIPVIPVQVIKNVMNAPRPLKFFQHAEWIHTHPDWSVHLEHSFPSGHATSAFCLFGFLALLLPEKYRGWGLLLFVLAVLVAYSRIYLAVHFFADVYAGSLIATILTTVIFAITSKYRQRLTNKSKS